MTEAHTALADLCNRLLDERLSYGSVRDTCIALQDFFHELTGYRFSDDVCPRHLYTSTGQAVDTRTASLCIVDFRRTQQFICSLHQAIAVVRARHPERPVTILYAGTGPFATLCTPLITRWRPDEVQFVWVELNEISFGLLELTRQRLGLDPYVTAVLNEDAATLRLPPGIIPDILLSETMKPALEKEPQAAILFNLLPQCATDAVLIPQSIIISVVLHGDLTVFPDRILSLGELWRLDARWIRERVAVKAESAAWDNEVVVEIPGQLPPSLNRISLFTQLDLFGDYCLGLNESGITIPRRISLPENWQGLQQLHFRYELGNPTGFVINPVFAPGLQPTGISKQ
jgi:hypothetical protein